MDSDPDARGYSGMTDQAAADDLNVLRNVRIRAVMAGDEILDKTDGSELTALTAVEMTTWLSLCAIDRVDPANDGPMVAVASGMTSFAQTITNLQAARNETVSDGVKYGFGEVIIGDVQNAGAL